MDKIDGMGWIVKIVPTSTMVDNREYSHDCGVVYGLCHCYGAHVRRHIVV
jgi:hypothetical protein